MSALADRVRALAGYRGAAAEVVRAVEQVERDRDAAVQRAELAEAECRSAVAAATSVAGTAVEILTRMQLMTAVVDAASAYRDGDDDGGALRAALAAYEAHVKARQKAAD